MDIINDVEICQDNENKFIIKNKETGKYIKLGSEETKYLLKFAKNKSDYSHININIQNSLTIEQEKYLYEYFKKVGLITDKEDNTHSEESKKTFKEKIKIKLKDITKIPLIAIDPDNFLEKRIKIIRMFFSKPAIFLYCSILIIGTYLMIQNGMTIINEDVFSIRIIDSVYLIIMMFCTVVLHEFAHASAIKYFGGKVNRMGILLFYFLPAAYADISDIYMLKRKRQKVMVSLAGVSVNIILGNLSMIIYAVGLTKGVHLLTFLFFYLYNIGVSLYNLIPFVKLDGYWFFSNLIGETNLLDKSFITLIALILDFKKFIISKVGICKRIGYIVFALCAILFNIFFWYKSITIINDFAITILGNKSIFVLGSIIILILSKIYEKTSICWNKYKSNQFGMF